MKKHLLTVAAAAGIMFTSFGGSVSAHENVSILLNQEIPYGRLRKLINYQSQT